MLKPQFPSRENLSYLLFVCSVILANILTSIEPASAAIRKVSSSISCFTCNSRNWTDSNCHDPFNPAMSKYIENCKVPKQNHIGVFPARFCVKVIGKAVSSGEDLVIRACALQSMDNQCGNFKFEGEIYKGCILTCDYDGCNGTESNLLSHSLMVPLICLLIYFLLLQASN